MDSVAEAVTWIGQKIDEMPVLGSAKRGIGKAIDWFSGDDKKEQPAASAKAAAEQSAAPNAKAAADTASAAKAPQMPDLPKGKSTSSTALADLSAPSGSDPDYFKQSFNDFSAAEEAAKKKGKKGSGGGGSRASASGTTVVTLAGDNSRPQTLYIPAGSRTGSSLPTTAGTPTALPQTPARLARRGGNAAQAAGSNGQIMVDLTQNFSLMSSDPRAVRRVLESIKPAM